MRLPEAQHTLAGPVGLTGCKNPVDTVTVESILTEGVPQLPDLSDLSHAEKDLASDAEPVPAHRRWAYCSHHQGLAHGTGGGGHRRTTGSATEARRTKRGTPQGGVISPLLANLYFRRAVAAP